MFIFYKNKTQSRPYYSKYFKIYNQFTQNILPSSSKSPIFSIKILKQPTNYRKNYGK